jgi:uncharacterized protein (DUF736 family)
MKKVCWQIDAISIEIEILFVKNKQKDCKRKPDFRPERFEG